TLHHQEEAFYVEQIDINVKPTLPHDFLHKTINIILQPYHIFPTLFLHEKLNPPLQLLLKNPPFHLHLLDIHHLSQTQHLQPIHSFKQNHHLTPFHLSNHLLIPPSLFQTPPSTYPSISTYHHLLLHPS
ncbi:condensation domain-containing protein, partial [Bacillus altitudinis]|uniref:condensation domain-containing protein n=1 Tax=Bacillus altitudinis TaxID=293387 RepID=UPI00119D31A8